jgi:GTP-binding protein HflX
MNQTIELYEAPEKVILVGVGLSDMSKSEPHDSLEELARLADTAGAEVIDKVIQYRDHPDSAYFIGKGKAEEITILREASDASSLIFDMDLSPAQTRNLEEITKGKVIDRSRLILDIFAQHARTKEAMLEVELAQLEYQLPRLTRMWTHLSRQVSGAGTKSGGIGTRGPGETQLEIDRRLIRNRMFNLKQALEKVRQNRQLERQNRKGILNMSLVGYTNAGKSTLLNALANESLYTDDKLFSTLDPTTRAVHLSDKYDVLLTDTVGFIKRLPHHLIASFRATLEEVGYSDMLLHVVDASQSNMQGQVLAVETVLRELKALDKPTIMVFNKMDRLEDRANLQELKHKYPNNIEVSALSGQGLDKLKSMLLDIASKNEIEINVNVPQTEGQIVNYIYNHGEVLERKFIDNLVQIRARMDRKYAGKLEKYIISGI